LPNNLLEELNLWFTKFKLLKREADWFLISLEENALFNNSFGDERLINFYKDLHYALVVFPNFSDSSYAGEDVLGFSPTDLKGRNLATKLLRAFMLLYKNDKAQILFNKKELNDLRQVMIRIYI